MDVSLFDEGIFGLYLTISQLQIIWKEWDSTFIKYFCVFVWPFPCCHIWKPHISIKKEILHAFMMDGAFSNSLPGEGIRNHHRILQMRKLLWENLNDLPEG